MASFIGRGAADSIVGTDRAIDLGGGNLVVLQGATMAGLDGGDFVL